MPPILVDTNVLVYFYDQNSPEKQACASRVLNGLREAGLGRLSTQALAEFINAAMRKLDPPLTAAQAMEQASLFAGSWIVLDLTPQIVLEAARGVRDHGLSYYDSQVWASRAPQPDSCHLQRRFPGWTDPGRGAFCQSICRDIWRG